MSSDKSGTDNIQWKGRYYNSLEQLEHKELEWQRIEGLLRQCILRLTLAADDSDEQLSQQMGDLRRAIKKGTESVNLSTAMDGLSKSISRLDSVRKERSILPTTEVFMRELINSLSVPQPLSEKAELLLKAFHEESFNHKEWLKELNALIAETVQHPCEPKHENTSSKSLIGRLFSGKSVVQSTQGVASSSRDDIPPVHEVLRQLLEELPLPAVLHPKAEKLQISLAMGLPPGGVTDVLKAIADLVAEMRIQVQDEKRGVEEFLKQLTVNLKQLDTGFQESVANQQGLFKEGADLDTAMKAQMQAIEGSVKEVNELETLKEMIQHRVIEIREHMDGFHQAVDNRYKIAERKNNELKMQIGRLEKETAVLRKRIKKESRQAQMDPLTGINNRLAYDEWIEKEYKRWQRYPYGLVMIVWDVDNFKSVNDTYGHQAGDKVLRVIASMMSGLIRETDFIARYGGEEFVMLLPETTLDDAITLVEKIRSNIEHAEFHHNNKQVEVTISGGVSQFGEGDDPDAVFTRADRALYQAKAKGKNQWQCG